MRGRRIGLELCSFLKIRIAILEMRNCEPKHIFLFSFPFNFKFQKNFTNCRGIAIIIL